MADIIKVLNTIRANASADYIKLVPVATRENFTTVGASILEYTKQSNEFVDALVNRIALTVVNNRQFKNPLSVLKKGDIPLGQDVQEIYTNPAVSQEYDGSSTDLLKVFKPDVKTAYYRMNRQAKFTVTIRQQDLARAFTSISAFDTFLSSIITSMQSGDEIEQFNLSKQLMSMAYENGTITEININTDTNLSWSQINALPNPDEFISKWLVKSIKSFSKLMSFPSSSYNKFAFKKGGNATPLITWSPVDKQVLILPSNVETNMEVEVLAYAFNIDKAEVKTRTLTVDSFNGSPILGLLADESCFQIRENGLWTKSFDNGDTLAITYWLHHWQTFGYSVLANSIVFTYTPNTVTLATGSLGVIGDTKITGLAVSTNYNVSVNGEESTVVQTNSSGELTGLSNTDTYFVSAIV
jgi:molybdopterin converting factor small subunit